MGVPAFFRWLSKKYPSIVVNCNERKQQEVDGVTVPVDATEPNPMGVEFDNLYLDMNGIIHPCTHPEHKPQPKNEDEMFVNIFEYIDRLFDIVRPRRVLYMAIDGVAPRAKMNQQRSRRFRAAKESFEKQEEIQKVRDRLEADGMPAPPRKEPGEHFDSNCITPGTPFMARLALALRYYIHDRQQTNKAWQSITVILSDANVPGEGEHKIMDFIRKQRGQPDHDPNTHHCLCGADADLIMLGLATHEPNFTIIREEFIPNKQKPCELCGQYGHELKECQGMPRGDFSESDPMPQGEASFIFIRLNVLREYLEKELAIPNLPFDYDLERAIDDWVFMCFFVGNDFLPHLPSLEIREGAIDRLIRIYKKTIYRTQGYLTDSGSVNLSRVQLILSDLGEMEDDIFKDRQETELGFRRRAKDRKRRMKSQSAPSFVPQGQFAPLPLGRGTGPVPLISPLKTSMDMRKQAMSTTAGKDNNSVQANGTAGPGGEAAKKGAKRKAEDSDDDEPPDEVRLWEEGWKERYYQSKFEVSASDSYFRYKVVTAYVEGLAWVLKYYYQGCSSWKWYFPFHYAPFASDFLNIGDIKIDFTALTDPFNPVEQLMGVFPAASRKHVPECFGKLMYDPESDIIDFYPTDFMVDLNGKKWAWMGVALLPFVEEKRLLAALQDVYPMLTPDEKERNVRGNDRLFISARHPAFTFIKEAVYGDGDCNKQWLKLMPSLFKGMAGEMILDNKATEPGGVLPAVIPGTPDLSCVQSVCVEYRDPQYNRGHVHKSCFLPGATMPERTIKASDWDEKEQRGTGRGFIPDNRGGGFRGGRGRGRGYTPMIGFTRDRQYAQMGDAGHRMLGAAAGIGGKYGNVPPPSTHNRSASYGGAGGGWGGSGGRDQRAGDEDRNFRSSGYSSRGGGGNGGYGGSPQGGGGAPVAWQQSMRNQAQAFQQNLYQDMVRDQYNQSGTGYGGRGGGMRPPAAQRGAYQQGGYGSQQQQSGGYNNRRGGGGRW